MPVTRDGAPTLALQGRYETVVDAMEAAAHQFGERDAYVEGGRHISFADWNRAADGLAAGLAERGVGVGDVVCIAISASIDYAICWAAIAKLGAVASGINPRLGPREFSAIIQRCSPRLVIVENGSKVSQEALHTIFMPRAGLADHYTRPGPAARPPLKATDPVVIVWTSGTTGMPKGAWFDHRNLAAAISMAGPMAAPFDRQLAQTPFAHSGYMSKLWQQLAFGITLVIAPVPWKASEMLRLMVDEGITVAGGAPTQWAKLLELPELEEADLSRLRLCVTATAPAAPDLVEKVVRRVGCPMIVRYAMTESPSISGTVAGDAPEVLYRTVGRPQAGVELVVSDEKGVPVADGQVGRIRVRSACVMRGYWGDAQATAQALTADGWLISGDLGYIDAGGNLVLVGRVGDMYIRGGYNVYPLEVENVLSEHPGVAQASVIGVAAPVIGEIGVAFVVPADPARPPSGEELRSWCRERLADYKAPDRVVIVRELPLTAMLKVNKDALRASNPAA